MYRSHSRYTPARSVYRSGDFVRAPLYGGQLRPVSAQVAADNVVNFTARHPILAAWLAAKAPSFDFAASLKNAVERYGDLTENQTAAVERLIARDAERTAAPRETHAVDVARIVASFAAASASGLRRPTLTVNGVSLSLAPATGRNPGAIYVKDDGIYVGKIVDGQFQPGRDFGNNPTTLERLRALAADPLAAARAHGGLTGNCSCCGRTLTDPVSVANGIGPICAGRYGWSL